jgi:gamma-glutamyltranspeptidase/glutathione hydrolase
VRGESPQTTHFSIVDRDGLAVANTYTLNGAFGSGVTIEGTGVLFNNEMDDFAAKPGTPNLFGLIQGERNAVAPQKRPLSSMTPTVVLRPDKSLWFVCGSPGGPTIINTVLQTVVNVIDHGMDIGQALNASRIHHQWLPDEIVFEDNLPASVRKELEGRGHRFAAKPRRIGDAQAVLQTETGLRYGASDKRHDGISVAE